MTALLREGLRELGLDESRAETLERFAALLLKKNEVMNLTAITEPEAVAQLHLLDSAALTRFVDLSGKTVVDVGTGAGFPGMPLRILRSDAARQPRQAHRVARGGLRYAGAEARGMRSRAGGGICRRTSGKL